MLRIGDLSRSFREGERVHRVLDHANAAIAAGEVVAIIGRSGSGKSTLLNLISGIDRPDGGRPGCPDKQSPENVEWRSKES